MIRISGGRWALQIRWISVSGRAVFLSVALALFSIWFFASILFPVLEYWGDWERTQAIWNRWQGYNVGVLAVMASIIALYATQSHAISEKKGIFLGALALLPEQLSQLHDYYSKSVDAIFSARDQIPTGKSKEVGTFTGSFPDYPISAHPIIKECLVHGDKEFRQFVSGLLKNMQVHHSRMREIYIGGASSKNLITTRHELENNLAYASIIGKKIDMLFDYARNEKFGKNMLDKENCYLSLIFIEADIENIDGIDEKIKFNIDRDGDWSRPF